MKIRKIVLFSIIVFSLALNACAPSKADETMMENPTVVMPEKPTDDMMANPTQDMVDQPTDAMLEKTKDGSMMDTTSAPDEMMDITPSPDSMMAESTNGSMMDTPSWLGESLTEVTTSETFTIHDFKGKVVLVELMAEWCSTCKKQQMEVKLLLDQLGMPVDLITIALDIDPNENADTLKTYAANNGFDWMYAIAPANVSREIGNLYGDLYLNPPSAPMLIIDRNGEVHLLPFGIKSADDLMKAIDPYRSGM